MINVPGKITEERNGWIMPQSTWYAGNDMLFKSVAGAKCNIVKGDGSGKSVWLWFSRQQGQLKICNQVSNMVTYLVWKGLSGREREREPWGREIS